MKTRSTPYYVKTRESKWQGNCGACNVRRHCRIRPNPTHRAMRADHHILHSTMYNRAGPIMLYPIVHTEKIKSAEHYQFHVRMYVQLLINSTGGFRWWPNRVRRHVVMPRNRPDSLLEKKKKHKENSSSLRSHRTHNMVRSQAPIKYYCNRNQHICFAKLNSTLIRID